MGVLDATADPANIVQALVYTLLDVFNAARDLHQTLRNKERRDYEQRLRSRGYPKSRRIEYVDEGENSTDESIILDKAAVTRQFEIGFQEVGKVYALGDVLSQTALQSAIITLQSVIITTFLYGPTSPDPISHHLSNILAASRAAGTVSVDVLAAQQQRQLSVKLPPCRPSQSPEAHVEHHQPPPYPVTVASSTHKPSTHKPSTHKPSTLTHKTSTLTHKPSTTTHSTALVKSRREPPLSSDGTLTLTNPTIDDLVSRPKTLRTDTESTCYSGLTSYGNEITPNSQYCLYARDLQRHPSQKLHSSITSSSSPSCPYCNRTLHLSPGKSWEVFKDDKGQERCFNIQNRFIVKCHREGADGGYSCILCSRSRFAKMGTVCGDVKALIRHIWKDHDIHELESEQNAIEVVEKKAESKRDSVMSFTESRSCRRTASLGPSRHGRRR